MADAPPTLTLERAAHGAAADVLALLEAQYAEHAIRSDGARLAAAVAHLQDDPERGALLLVREGERALALAALSFTSSLEHSARIAWLEELYVVPERRGQGLGGALVERAAALAAESGCQALELEVTADHLRAERLYARSGFENIHRNRWLRRLTPPAVPRRAGSALDHVSLGASDLARSRAFYDAALAPLGLVAHPQPGGDVGYGPPGAEPLEGFALYVGFEDSPARAQERPRSEPPGERRSDAPSPGFHLALRAPHRAAVRAFHAAALAHGGRDLGAPGPRPRYHAHYYAAFAADPDGHRIEAVCHTPELDPELKPR